MSGRCPVQSCLLEIRLYIYIMQMTFPNQIRTSLHVPPQLHPPTPPHNRRHQSLPLRTCHSHTAPSNPSPTTPATQMPALSLTLTAPKHHSLSSPFLPSATSANVFTYTAPPSKPSQSTIAKTTYTFGKNGNRACRRRSARLAHWRREGR